MPNPRARVYWKQLITRLHRAESYIQRYDLQLEENLTSEQWACVLSTLQAILDCLALLPSNEPE